MIRTTKSRMTGVGMLEILIALLVVAIGVLGLAQLQGVATKQNHNAYLRSQATILAYSITDRMRANQENADTYDITFDDSAPTGTSVRDEDLNHWLTALDTLLPAGDGEIVQAGDNFTISVRYDDNRNPDDDDQAEMLQVTVETQVKGAI